MSRFLVRCRREEKGQDMDSCRGLSDGSVWKANRTLFPTFDQTPIAPPSVLDKMKVASERRVFVRTENCVSMTRDHE